MLITNSDVRKLISAVGGEQALLDPVLRTRAEQAAFLLRSHALARPELAQDYNAYDALLQLAKGPRRTQLLLSWVLHYVPMHEAIRAPVERLTRLPIVVTQNAQTAAA